MTTKKNKLIIIYLPNGKEVKYSTKNLGGNEYEIAKEISCYTGVAFIVLNEDKKEIIRQYIGIPYFIEEF